MLAAFRAVRRLFDRREGSLEGASSDEELLARYDRSSDQWGFPRSGAFWDPVLLAHQGGQLGEGKRVAVIDSGFDVTVPRLQEKHGARLRMRDPNGTSRTHGTIVALLVAAVAPKVSLDLYEVWRGSRLDGRATLDALRLAADSDATVVNLSFGMSARSPSIRDLLANKVSSEHCAYCEAASEVRQRGKLVVAAVGNSQRGLFCPARCRDVFSVGFQLERREIQTLEDGGQLEAAFGEMPSFSQALRPDVTLMQPDGVLGTSFAAPLVSGLAALVDDPLELPKLAAAATIASNGDVLMAMGSTDTNERVRAIDSFYKKAWEMLPHRHAAEEGRPCVACAVLAQSVYVNAGNFLAQVGRTAFAEGMLRAASVFAPRSPHAAATLGAVLEDRARSMLSTQGAAAPALALLAEARKEYMRALEIRPGFSVYEKELARIDALVQSAHKGTG